MVAFQFSTLSREALLMLIPVTVTDSTLKIDSDKV